MTQPPLVGLVDTSIWIGFELGRIDRPVQRVATSIITIGELRWGVLTASTTETRSMRLATLRAAEETQPLLVDDPVAVAWSELRTRLKAENKRLPVNDAWIAATAIAHGLPLVTQDSDYDHVPGLNVIRI